MSDRGKHHGQPLKAKEVLRLYAAGERDFRGTILRGCSFRNADLSAANFTGADIRSARFINANLQKAAFCYARGGLQRRWMASQIALIIVIAALAGSLQGFAGYVIGFYFNTGGTADFIAAIASTILVAFTFFAIAQQGFTIRALGSIAFAVAVTVTVAVAVVVAIAGTRTEAISMAFNLAVSCAFAGAVAGAGAFVGTGAVAVAFAVSDAVAVSGAIAFGIAVAVASAFAMVGAVAFVVAAASLLLSLYVNRCICRDAPKFRNLHVIGQAFAALGGTNFSGADLMGASFAHAHLKSVSFADSLQQSTILDRVRWHQGQKLDRARLGTSNLQDPRVRQLLVTLNGVDQDLSNADLRGANLAGKTALQRIILKGANLNGATLAGAALHEANLTETQCVGANFTRAQLTGACLEAWNIDETTILKDVDCEYVFLKEKPDRRGNRERRPHNPNKVFEPGDFEKFFKEMLDTVQILIRQGI
ncbi:MAG: pentapeptide repeat-containing protein, partial [Cyanobacteria bacterium P01_C01_bin.70]